MATLCIQTLPNPHLHQTGTREREPRTRQSKSTPVQGVSHKCVLSQCSGELTKTQLFILQHIDLITCQVALENLLGDTQQGTHPHVWPQAPAASIPDSGPIWP